MDLVNQLNESESGQYAIGWSVLMLLIASILAVSSLLSLLNLQWFADVLLIPPVYDRTVYSRILEYSHYTAVVHLVAVLCIVFVMSLYRSTFWLRALPCVGVTLGLTIDIAGLSQLHPFPMHLDALLWLMVRAAIAATLMLYALQLRSVRTRA